MVTPKFIYLCFLFALKIFGAQIPSDENLEDIMSLWIKKQFPDDQKIIFKTLEINKIEYPEQFTNSLRALYQTVFDENDKYRFAEDFIFMIKPAQQDALITRKCVLEKIYEKLDSPQDTFIWDKTFNEMSHFELIATGVIFSMFLTDNNFDSSEKYRKIRPVASHDALLLSINFVKSRQKNWCFGLILETMDFFRRLNIGGHFQAIKGALKILSSHESKYGPLESWIIVRIIKLCYYNQNSFNSDFQKLIEKLLAEIKNIDKSYLSDYFGEQALSIGLKGDRYSFIQYSELWHNACVLF